MYDCNSVKKIDYDIEIGVMVSEKKASQAIRFAEDKKIKIPKKKVFETKKSYQRRINKFYFYVLRIRTNVKEMSNLSKKAKINYETAKKYKTISIRDAFKEKIENSKLLELDYTEKVENIFRESKQKLVLANNLFDESQKILSK